MTKKKYSTEKKLEIIERVEKGEPKSSISRDTGISALTIKNWVDKKDDLITQLFEESRNKKGTNKKKRYGERLKNLVLFRVENGESIYRVSRELGIPYLTIKNWVFVAQNETDPKSEISIPDSKDIIISEEEKRELIQIMEENVRNETPEDALLRHIERQNAEIADLRKEIDGYKESGTRAETPEEILLRQIERMNSEIAAQRKQISDLEDEVKVLKMTAVLMSKKIPSGALDS